MSTFHLNLVNHLRKDLVLGLRGKFIGEFTQKRNLSFRIQICRDLAPMMSSRLLRKFKMKTKASLLEKRRIKKCVRLYIYCFMNNLLAFNFPSNPGPGYYNDQNNMNKTVTYYNSKFRNSGS